MTLTGDVGQDQYGLQIQVQISTIPVGQVGKMPFCSWMSNIHELRGHSGVSRWRSLTHSILINLFIKSGLNNFLLSIVLVQEYSVVFRRGGSRKAYILPHNSRAWVLVYRTPRRLKSAILVSCDFLS